MNLHISPVRHNSYPGFTSKKTEEAEIKNTQSIEPPEAFEDFDISYAAEIGQNIIKGEINDSDFELVNTKGPFKQKTLSGTINNKKVSLAYTNNTSHTNTLKGSIGDKSVNLNIKNNPYLTEISGQFEDDNINLKIQNCRTHYLLKGKDNNGNSADLKIRLKGKYSTDTEALGKFELNPDIMPVIMNQICKTDFDNRAEKGPYAYPHINPFAYSYYPVPLYPFTNNSYNYPGYYI